MLSKIHPSLLVLALLAFPIAAVPADLVFAQSFPKIPKIKVPKPPNAPRPSSERPAELSGSTPSKGSEPVDYERQFVDDMQAINDISVSGNAEDPKHNADLDAKIATHMAAVDRVVEDNYPGVGQDQKGRYLNGALSLAETYAARTDQTINWSIERIDRNAGTTPWLAKSAYNDILSHDAYLYAAVKLFPDRPEFAAAKQKTEAALARLVSRDQAAAGFDAAALVAAKNVRMPAPIAGSAQAEGVFRRAWATSGIPYTIMKVHVTSGWRDKIEYGRLVGQRRDAAIAARDPNNPDRCNLYDFTVFRDRSGNVRRDSHSTKRIACENVPN